MQVAKRNTGLEALRIVATLMICMIHLLYMGGLLVDVPLGTSLYFAVWGMEILGSCGANVYMLLSGFVGVEAEWHPSRVVCLWLQVVVLSLGETLLSIFITPGYASSEIYKLSAFPVTQGTFWYITAYCFAFFLFPFANAALNHMNNRQLGVFLLTVTCLAVYESRKNCFGFGGGYSMNWLLCLYCVGGAVRKLKMEKWLQNRQYIILYFVFSGMNFSIKMIGSKWNNMFLNDIALSYINILMVAAAVCLLCGFATLRLERVQKWISPIAGTCLGVYILQTHPYFWNQHMAGRAAYLVNSSVGKFLASISVLTLSLFLGFAVIDFGRRLLFQGLKVEKRTRCAENWLRDKLKRFAVEAERRSRKP